MFDTPEVRHSVLAALHEYVTACERAVANVKAAIAELEMAGGFPGEDIARSAVQSFFENAPAGSPAATEPTPEEPKKPRGRPRKAAAATPESVPGENGSDTPPDSAAGEDSAPPATPGPEAISEQQRLAESFANPTATATAAANPFAAPPPADYNPFADASE
jgi:hypothetical protein